MKRLLLIAALLAPVTRSLAQSRAASLPVIHPKITVLGELRDTTLEGSQVPDEAALSPRGTLIAFNTDHDLRIWSTATHSSSILLNGWSESIVWSPAGDAIAFAHEDDQGNQEFIWTQRLNPTTGRAIGSPQRVSLSATTGNAGQFSPDGKLIAFPRLDAGRRSSLVVVAANGGAERALASGFGVRRLRWSSDGSEIYYVASSDSARKTATLYRVALSGGASSTVHEFSGNGDPPAISADAHLVGLPQPRTIEGNSVVYADFSGKSIARIAYPGDVELSDWSGSYRVAGFRIVHPRGLRIVNVADGRSRELIDTTAEVIAAAWFADGRRIAAILVRDGRYALTTMNADGTNIRSLALAALPQHTYDLPEPANARLQVSPDGRYATFLGHGRHSLELMDLTTGTQRTLARAQFTLTPFWRADSKSIRYIRHEDSPSANETRGVHEVSLDGTDKIVRVLPRSKYPPIIWSYDYNAVAAWGAGASMIIPLDGKPDQVVARAPVHGGGALSIDRRTVALFLGKDGVPTRKLTLVSLPDSSQRDIDLPFLPFGPMRFSPDDRRTFIRGRDTAEGPMTIYSVPLDGGQPRAVATVDSRELAGVIELSPSGGSVLYSVAGTRRATFLALDFSDLTARVTQAGKTP